MISFSIYFLFCNILISILIGVLFLAKRIVRKHLSGCSQYHIWFLLFLVLTVPFLTIRPAGSSQIIHWLYSIQAVILPDTDTAIPATSAAPLSPADWMNDFAVSVTRDSAPMTAYIPFLLWVGGMSVMTVSLMLSRIHLYRLERSALPLQDTRIKILYTDCRSKLQIKRNIPICSTAFMRSPGIVGMIFPRIYIPIHLIADFNENDIRYMLLHELQHYKHKDAFINFLMNLFSIIYWFNPVVWCALKEARTDREIACDTSVLQTLDARDYIAYGNTLLNFAQKTSLSPFTLATGIDGSAKQIKKRILNIATYTPQTRKRRIKERIISAVIMLLILESTTLFPVFASDTKASLPKNAIIQTENLSDYFAGYEGCFVLYDTNADTWDIYNETLATKLFSPDSTYKIYSALFALENQYISPDSSSLAWNGQSYAYSAWNRDQDLTSAMQNSVNWYFETLDQKADPDSLNDFYQLIGYGNHDLSGGAGFWLESSLKISAVEQVELLRKLYYNEFEFDDRNVQAVRDSIRLSSAGQAVLSGKTGTGMINGKSVSGWLVGYVESNGNTWFFATNIQGADHTDGVAASEITLDILAAKHIYRDPNANPL